MSRFFLAVVGRARSLALTGALGQRGNAPYIGAMTAQAIDLLSDRARDIFRLVVESYLGSGIPVGSRTISRLPGLSLSPASIRNVMQDLEEAGLLAAPHTSAGRMPTQAGLRLFVRRDDAGGRAQRGGPADH